MNLRNTKTNLILTKVKFKNCSHFVCILLCTTVVRNTAWSTCDNIPPFYLLTTTIAQMLSSEGQRITLDDEVFVFALRLGKGWDA